MRSETNAFFCKTTQIPNPTLSLTPAQTKRVLTPDFSAELAHFSPAIASPTSFPNSNDLPEPEHYGNLGNTMERQTQDITAKWSTWRGCGLIPSRREVEIPREYWPHIAESVLITLEIHRTSYRAGRGVPACAIALF